MCSDKSLNDELLQKCPAPAGHSEPVESKNIVPLDAFNSDLAAHKGRTDHKAECIAQIILDVFNQHYQIFLNITRDAKTRFITSDWDAGHRASIERIKLYTKRVTEASDQLSSEFNFDQSDRQLWQKVKQYYISMLYEHKQPELAETFYNSVFTWLFDRRYYNNTNIFVRPSISTEYLTGSEPTYYSFYPAKDGIKNCMQAILDVFDLGLPFENYPRDVQHLVEQFECRFKSKKNNRVSFQLQVLSSLFYRNKAAYIVGRIFNGLNYWPLVIPVLNNEKQQVYIDAMVANKKDIKNLFSFARAYFMVYTEVPSAVVRFLQKILPDKTVSELYTSIGLQKQGKSEFYRAFLHHLEHSNDQFNISAGTRGMVMSVFTLPSYPFVFKVINDRFAPPKDATPEQVKQKYQFVKMHDRVGRMADTLEFSYVALPLSRFSDELLQELKNKINNSLEIKDDQIIIRHLYIERRLIPLNLFLENASGKELENAIIEYGNAIKEMAAANIFPGDLLTKNFGLTRFGRVIFYDYDEIELLVDCNFRKIPPPRYPEDEMAAEPWYSIAPLDIFPEEFLPFLFSTAEQRQIFLKHHANLLDAEYWQCIQEDISSGHYAHVFSYSKDIRFQYLYQDFGDPAEA